VPIEFAPAVAPSRRLDSAWRDDAVEAAFDALLERERPDAVLVLQLLWGLSLGLVERARARGARTVVTLTDFGLLCHRGQMFDHREQRCGGPHAAATCAACLRRPSASTAPWPQRALHGLLADAAASAGGLLGAVTRADVERREAAARAALASADAVVAPTEHLARTFAHLLPQGATVLPYAFDAAPYALPRAARPAGRMRFAFIGQFAAHKGLHVLLAAFQGAAQRAAAHGTTFGLRLFGSAPTGARGRYARRLLARLPGGVEVAGTFEPGAAPRVLAEVDALVVPSLWDENAPLACLEARAAGVPVVASDVPGIREVVEHGRHGLLVEPDSVPALVEALVAAERCAPPPRGLPLDLASHVERLERLLRR
jgi:hypothetical protein